MVTKRFPIAVLALILVASTAAITMATPARACAETVSRIAYVHREACTTSLWVMTPDGANSSQISREFADISHPTWSPDHSSIVFAADAGSGYDIYLLLISGAGTVRLTDNPAWDGTPSFSPDGSRILFSSDRSGHRQLWTTGIDGTSPQQLTSFDDSLAPIWASYSPDGTKIVFASVDDANTNVFVMNADGTGVKRLTTNPYEDAEPSWSPDGTRIVWSATDRSFSSIWTMNADGSDKVQLTDAACRSDRSPRYSPDGARVVFSSSAGGKPTIQSVSVTDPTDEVQLTFLTTAGAIDPAWDVLDTSPPPPTTTTTTVDTPVVPAYAC
jgi:TolB protein